MKNSDTPFADHRCEQILTALQDSVLLVANSQKNAKISIFSNEGKILAAISQGDNLIMKDIPHLTGVSFRSTFDCVQKLVELGIVEKKRDECDKRAVTLHINRTNLCQSICGNK